MNLTAQMVSAVFGALASLLLALLLRAVVGMSRDVKRFMAEHLWLLATADWSRKTLQMILAELGLNGEPPPEWPRHRK